MDDLICDEKDDGRYLEMYAGQRLTIQLKENPTTGYKWSEPRFDEQILTVKTNEFLSPASRGIGGSGLRRFVFVPKRIGETAVSSNNVRPWSPDAPAAKFTINIRVLTIESA
jgi:inhibitor of cysteine peptidase